MVKERKMVKVGNFVLIDTEWFLVEDTPFGDDFFFVSDNEGTEYEFNYEDISEVKSV